MQVYKSFFLRNMAQAPQFSMRPKINCCYQNMNLQVSHPSLPKISMIGYGYVFSALKQQPQYTPENQRPVPKMMVLKIRLQRLGDFKGVYWVHPVLLLMEEILHHLGCIKPCTWWDKLPTSTGSQDFLPSTVVLLIFWGGNYLIITSAPEDQGSISVGIDFIFPTFFPRILNLAKRF